MDLSRNWLSEFVDTADISDKDFCDAMTLSGSKVETARRTDTGIEKIVVGRIEAMEKHPDSDHLWVCRIDVGQGAPLQIVTGAQNQRVGDYVPVALDGALLPDGKRIEATTVHHVFPREEFPEYQWEPWNLVSLAGDVHDQMHDRVTGTLTENGAELLKRIARREGVVVPLRYR